METVPIIILIISIALHTHIQVLSSIPLEALNVLTRLRLLVSCSCWHIAAVHLLLATSHIDEDTPISPVVYTLQTHLACTLTSLVKQRGKRRGGAMGLPENLLPADLLARWCYVATKGLVHKGKVLYYGVAHACRYCTEFVL